MRRERGQKTASLSMQLVAMVFVLSFVCTVQWTIHNVRESMKVSSFLPGTNSRECTQARLYNDATADSECARRMRRTGRHESYHRDDEGRHGPTDIFYIEGGSFVREWRHLDDDDE